MSRIIGPATPGQGFPYRVDMKEPSSPAGALPVGARDGHPPAPGSGSVVRALRYVYRVPLLLWHLLIDLPLAVLLLSPLTATWRVGEERLDHRVIRLWSAGLARICGFRLRRQGTPLDGATLFVANHVTWADIVVLNSQRMMG